ncbi:MAG: 3-deoxy-D-manno-octulosonic acid transferase [Desulfobacterales bacterium]|nr:MAG: 3-deoxy-D-manno-octulosonic acid transferase [Desulfobacterales bacterium]
MLWTAALPFLSLMPRIREGWQQRILRYCPTGPFDIWLQAASGGEAFIAAKIVEELDTMVPAGRQLTVLSTTGTRQGYDVLSRAMQTFNANRSINPAVSYFPFDAPFLMQKAFSRFNPTVAVIIETELWPGFLLTAKKYGVPVLLVNGRMSEKSFHSYRHLKTFFKRYGPLKILAISEKDRQRFAKLTGADRTDVMNNIKYDQISLPPEETPYNIPLCLPESVPFIVLGSVRREEELQIVRTIKLIRAIKPDAVIGLFPKHLERVTPWLQLLTENEIPAVLRNTPVRDIVPGDVVVWNRFGELHDAYRRADAAFVGGSLVNLGGQNFLEPLISGLKPVIGPHWQNFSWVDHRLFSQGLVRQVTNEEELADLLLTDLPSRSDREKTVQAAMALLAEHKGGTRQACQMILNGLKERRKN